MSKSHPRPIKPESLRMEAKTVFKFPGWFWCTARVKNHWFSIFLFPLMFSNIWYYQTFCFANLWVQGLCNYWWSWVYLYNFIQHSNIFSMEFHNSIENYVWHISPIFFLFNCLLLLICRHFLYILNSNCERGAYNCQISTLVNNLSFHLFVLPIIYRSLNFLIYLNLSILSFMLCMMRNLKYFLHDFVNLCFYLFFKKFYSYTFSQWSF